VLPEVVPAHCLRQFEVVFGHSVAGDRLGRQADRLVEHVTRQADPEGGHAQHRWR